MRDINIQITAARQLTELKIWAVCFLLAFLLNVVSIVIYGTEWIELLTQLFWVFAISIFIYFVALMFRLLYCAIRRGTVKSKKQL